MKYGLVNVSARGIAAMCMALSQGAAWAQSEVVVIDLAGQEGQPSLPFYAQDLLVAQQNRGMSDFALAALQLYESKRGRQAESQHERALAVVDWVASNIRHPEFWPEDPLQPRELEVSTIFESLRWDPLRIIQTALAYRSTLGVLCTAQNVAAAGLMNALGMHARLVHVQGHDGLEYYSFAEHRWIWMDSTFNEHYRRINDDGSYSYLGVRELNALTLAGELGRVEAVKHGTPSGAYSNGTYIRHNPNGFRQYAVSLYMNNYNGYGHLATILETVVYEPKLPADFPLTPNDQVLYLSDPANCVDPASANCKWGAAWTLWPKTDSASRLNPQLDELKVNVLTREGEPATASTLNSQILLELRSVLPYTSQFQLRWGSEGSWEVLAMPKTISALPVTLRASVPLTPASTTGLRSFSLRALDTVNNATKEVTLTLRTSAL